MTNTCPWTRRAVRTAVISLILCVLAGFAVTGEAATRAGRQKPQAAKKSVSAGKSASSRKPITVKRTASSRKPTTVRRATSSRSKLGIGRTKSSRYRATSRVRRVLEAPIPRFKTDADGSLVPDLHAAAAIIYNPDTHEVLWEENSRDQRSIASITKVMTAVVFVESDPDVSQIVTIGRSDVYAASTTHLRAGYEVGVQDLLHLLLISSDNAAARALARVSPWGESGFVARMNEKGTELGLRSTTFADPSGLDAANVSSAYDMARLIAYASSDDRISEIMRKAEYRLPLGRRQVTIHSTNQLLTSTDTEGSILGAKTGFISRSGYCLATFLRLPSVNQQVAVVVLGARSNRGRFNEVRNLMRWMSLKAPTLFDRRDDGTD